MRHILSLKEQSKEDLLTMIDIAVKLKNKRKKNELTNYLENKTLIMLFEKTSTRTRLSFESAMTELGGHAIFLDTRTTQFALADFNDEIQAVMRFGHILMYRAKKSANVALAASHNRIPVIDACSEKYHPAQALTDILTMSEYAGGIDKIKKIAWLGIENNVSNTLVLACAKLGISVTIIAPEVDEASIDEELNAMANQTGLVSRTTDIAEGLRDAQFVHTDTWINMECFDTNGNILPEKQSDYDRIKQTFIPYQLNAQLINRHCPKAFIMHCLPAHVGYEISRDALDHHNSIVFDQAENRLHMQKGILMWQMEREQDVLFFNPSK